LPIALNHCYPVADPDFGAGILAAAKIDPKDGWIVSPTAGETGGSAAGTKLTIKLADASTPAQCAFSYTSPAAADAAPEITFNVSAC
jgi:hypothetical protein